MSVIAFFDVIGVLGPCRNVAKAINILNWAGCVTSLHAIIVKSEYIFASKVDKFACNILCKSVLGY